MSMPITTGFRLELPSARIPLTALSEVNAVLAAVGTRVWPLDLGSAPADIRRWLRQRTLSGAEAERIKTYFLLSRQRLLEIIAAAGRRPQVPGGGELSTFVSPHNYAYPQLYVVQDGSEYSRFDRFHVNVANDGTGVDEIMQVLSGSGVRLLQRAPDAGVLSLQLDCPDEDSGWLLTYNGAHPHIGSLSGVVPGTKVFMQVIGPARWVMRYEPWP
jgi:hypothetical protein